MCKFIDSYLSTLMNTNWGLYALRNHMLTNLMFNACTILAFVSPEHAMSLIPYAVFSICLGGIVYFQIVYNDAREAKLERLNRLSPKENKHKRYWIFGAYQLLTIVLLIQSLVYLKANSTPQ